MHKQIDGRTACMRIQEKAISSLETAHVATPAHLAAPTLLLLLLSAACMLPLVLALTTAYDDDVEGPLASTKRKMCVSHPHLPTKPHVLSILTWCVNLSNAYAYVQRRCTRTSPQVHACMP